MAAGFIILSDGRCFAPRWTVFDFMLNRILDELKLIENETNQDFSKWLSHLVPEEDDEYNGYGGFIKKNTDENIQRWLDLRELTAENQKLFWKATQNCIKKIILIKNKDKYHEHQILLFRTMLKMNKLAKIKDNPTNLNHWKDKVEPLSNKKSGPGW